MQPERDPGVAFATVSTKWAEVDVAALRANAAALAALAGPGCAVMAMVKASGYGHGAVLASTAAIAGGASWLGVSSVSEAVELRRWGIECRILNTGWTMPAEMATAVAQGIDVAVVAPDDVAAARSAARELGRPARVHWKIDTGMGRLGTRVDGMTAMREALAAASADVVVAGAFTHFACADAESTDHTEAQHARFLALADDLRDAFPDVRLHCANSAAALRLPQTHHDIIRPGIALYGYPPAHCEGLIEVRPALRVCAVVTQVKHLESGEGVGYGQEWVAQRPSTVATLAAGYADGVDRRNGNRGAVIAGGALCPIIGRVSMDQVSIDVTDAEPVSPGDTAVLLGTAGGLTLDAAEIGATIGTISYEVLCSISSRVPRVPVNVETTA